MAAPGAIPDLMVEAHSHGVRTPWLRAGTCSNAAAPRSDAVEEAVVVMEDDETFDAVVAASLIAKAKCNSTPHLDGSTLRGGRSLRRAAA